MLMCRKESGTLEFFLVHPGGPFYAKKNEGVWSIPKGLPEGEEAPDATAQREFFEETGIKPVPPFHPLGTTKLKSGKTIHAWLFFGAWDAAQGVSSNTFTLEWPPRSGKFIEAPEVDRGAWMRYEEAAVMINPKQVVFLERARDIIKL